MKILTVLVLCIVCCVNAYTIFPLPGQSVGVNPKFSGFTKTTKSPQVPQLNSRLGSLEPRPFQSQSSNIPELNIGNVVRPSNIAQSAAPSTQPTKSVEILNSVINQQSSSVRIVTPASFANQQSFVPTRPFAVGRPPANDLLPPTEGSRPAVALITTTYPRPITTTVPSRPIVEVPFNDLLPPKNK